MCRSARTGSQRLAAGCRRLSAGCLHPGHGGTDCATECQASGLAGVSLGGLMGMMLAAQPKSPIRRLVVDDIGGYVGVEALQRIAAYVGQDPVFADRAGLEAYMREVNVGYGPLTAAQWAHVIEHGHRIDENGQWRQHYDPKLAEPFREGFSEPVALWPLWDLITCPVMILRGGLSDILTAETAAEMVSRKPGTILVEFEGIGHAPMLMEPEQVNPVRDFLQD
ncbi:MAG: alpha/beta hydrolase [Defluviicoccus sp.]|nr:MAG: alpha/beta hydrolase [Defluviicoccus sp.]